jgi:hypothetical protein
LSRLRSPLTLAALLALATAFAACGGGGDKSDESPQTVVDEATLQGIDSGQLDVSLDVKAAGKEGGNLDVNLSGPFQGAGAGKLPQLDMTAKAKGKVNGQNVDFDGGLTLLPNSAYVEYEGTEYEVDPTTFSFVQSALKQAQQQGGAAGESPGVTACQEEVGKLKVADFLDNLSNDGSAEVGGTTTTKVSGDLDVSGAIDALVELAEGPACSKQLGAVGALPSKGEVAEAKSEVKGAVKTAHADVYVGDDDIVRRVSAQLKVEPKRSGSGPKSVEIDLDLTLTEVNEEQEISAPGKARPLNDLFLKLGVNPIELLETLSGEGDGEGIGGLLEGLGEAGGGSSGGGSSGGRSSGSGSSGGGARQAYLNCIAGATSAADVQKCASKLR